MTNAYNPGRRFTLRSNYDKRIDPLTGKEGTFHSGQDFVAQAGTPIPTATSGTVVYSGFNKNLGNVVIVKNDTGEYSLYGHMLGSNQVELGQRIWPGDTIGLVGSTGLRTTGPHLHYSVITKKAGGIIEGSGDPRSSGSIGVPLNRKNTIDPAQYGNYDPTPRYLDEAMRAQQKMFGAIAGNAFANAAGTANMPAAGSFDAPSNQSPPPDARQTAPRLGRRISGKPGSTVFEAGTPAVPFAPTDDALSAGRQNPFDSRFGNWATFPAAPPNEVRPSDRRNFPDDPSATGMRLPMAAWRPAIRICRCHRRNLAGRSASSAASRCGYGPLRCRSGGC